MLFLLNDVIFDLSETYPAPLQDLRHFESLDLDALLTLGCELYAEEPLLHQKDAARARRLAWLIAHRVTGVNAAQFYAPEGGCNPLLVEPRFCILPETILQELRERSQAPRQKPQVASLADQLVWSQKAA